MSGGMVQNCTVVSNSAQRTDAGGSSDVTRGGGIRFEGGSVSNTVVVDNGIRVVTNIGVQISFTNASMMTNVGFSCSPDLVHNPAGTGNITNEPAFVDAAQGDYHLGDASPCRNAGRNQEWMGGAVDLDGNPRIEARVVDMGVYEMLSPETGVLLRVF